MTARRPIEFEFHRYSAHYAFDQSYETLVSLYLPDVPFAGRFVIELAWSSVFSRHAMNAIISTVDSTVDSDALMEEPT